MVILNWFRIFRNHNLLSPRQKLYSFTMWPPWIHVSCKCPWKWLKFPPDMRQLHPELPPLREAGLLHVAPGFGQTWAGTAGGQGAAAWDSVRLHVTAWRLQWPHSGKEYADPADHGLTPAHSEENEGKLLYIFMYRDNFEAVMPWHHMKLSPPS